MSSEDENRHSLTYWILLLIIVMFTIGTCDIHRKLDLVIEQQTKEKK